MMDQTLAQILTELYQAIAERDRLRTQISQMQQVIDSQLPVHNGSIEDLRRGETVPGSAPNDQKE